MIIKNAIQCNSCKEEIRSYNTHDFKMCSCGECGVDGGHDYLRRIGENYTDKSITFDGFTQYADVREHVVRGSRGMDGKKPLTYVPVTDMDDDYLDAIIKYEQLHRPNNKWLVIYQLEKLWREEQHVEPN